MTLSAVAEALNGRFGSVASAAPDRNRRNAAVALVLRGPPGVGDPPVRRCEILAIRRSESPRDPWSGQMALPGGSLDPADEGLLAAAVRETREETELPLDAGRDVLGRMETMRPRGARLPAISIWPFVFRTRAGAEARVASPEVASVYWFPVGELADPERRGSHRWRDGGLVRRFPCIKVEDRVIWGLTYRILTRFLEAVGE